MNGRRLYWFLLEAAWWFVLSAHLQNSTSHRPHVLHLWPHLAWGFPLKYLCEHLASHKTLTDLEKWQIEGVWQPAGGKTCLFTWEDPTEPQTCLPTANKRGGQEGMKAELQGKCRRKKVKEERKLQRDGIPAKILTHRDCRQVKPTYVCSYIHFPKNILFLQ